MAIGGFKTWECSVDLLNVLHERKVQADQVLEVSSLGLVLCQGAEPFWICSQLGCGTAIPTCYLFEQLVRSRQLTKEVKPAKFQLQDYNLQGRLHGIVLIGCQVLTIPIDLQFCNMSPYPIYY